MHHISHVGLVDALDLGWSIGAQQLSMRSAGTDTSVAPRRQPTLFRAHPSPTMPNATVATTSSSPPSLQSRWICNGQDQWGSGANLWPG